MKLSEQTAQLEEAYVKVCERAQYLENALKSIRNVWEAGQNDAVDDGETMSEIARAALESNNDAR